MSLHHPWRISHLSHSKGSRRKRDTVEEEQGVETFLYDKSDKVDMMLNPEKAEQYKNSVERTKQDIRWTLSLTLRDAIHNVE